MEQTAIVNIHINIDRVKGDLYHCVMNVDGDTAPVEEDAEFPLGTVDLLQSMYALENDGLLDYVNLPELGERLYNLLFPAALGERFDEILDSSRVGDRMRVILNTHHGQILSLPWELIMHRTRGYLCRDGNVSLVRTLGKEFRQLQHTLEAPPLKILMMVASPEDQPSLDFEREQDVLQTALEPLVRKGLMDIEYSEDGTLESLERDIKADRYHVLHLSGHGGFDREKAKGYFAFEDDDGRTDRVTADRLLDVLKGSDSIKLVLLGGCVTSKTDHAALSGMAQALCDAGVPLVIGFQLSVRDIVATRLVGHLYSRLSEGWGLDHALTDSRIEIQRFVSEHAQLLKDARGQVSWAIPTLYASSSLERIVDFDKEPVKRVEPRIKFSTRFGDIQYLERGFVGRRRDIRSCREMLENSPCLYLHGFGGIGKSTLATKLSERFARAGYRGLFLKGQVRVEGIVSQVAQALLNENDMDSYRTLISADVPSDAKLQYCIDNVFARASYLIILDNFEDNLNDDLMLDESLEEGLAALLSGIGPTPTRMIITSRYQLKSQPLKPHVGQYNLGEFSPSDAVKKMNRHDSLRVQSPEIKKQIYRTLGGHPKAIEDMAAVLDTEAVQWEQLEGKLRGVQDALQADFLLLEVLYDFLEAQEQGLLRRASVYTQPVSYNGLQIQVEYDIEGLISPLVERSLLQRGRDEKGGEAYYVHRITAQFLKGLTSDSEQRESHRRAAEYYGYEIRNNLMDHWNWLVAREHYLACGDLENAAGIALTFEKVLSNQGNYELAMQLDQETVERTPHERTKAAALHNIGIIHHCQGRYEEALKYYNDSLRIGQELGDKDGIAASLYQIGMIHQLQGRYEEALKYYNDSLSIRQELGDRAGIADSLGQIGIIHYRQGRYEEALKYYNDSLSIKQELGYKAGIASSLHQIGMVHQLQGRYEEALKYYNDSLSIKQELGYKDGIASSLHQIGMIHQDQGRYEEALKYYNDSLRISQELGDKAGIASSLHQIGMIHQDQGRYEEALKYYNDSLRISQELGDRAGIASSLGQIGFLHADQNEYGTAIRYTLRALLIYQSLGSPSAQIVANGLSRIRQRMGEAEFEKIVQTEMRETERHGPFVISE